MMETVIQYSILIVIGAFGLLGLLSPRTAMLWKGHGDSRWITGSAWYKTEYRTRVTATLLLTFALFGLVVKLFWGAD
jgi:hypothetical protein